MSLQARARPSFQAELDLNTVTDKLTEIKKKEMLYLVWRELDQEFPVVFDQCAEQTLWNGGRDTELRRPLTPEEEM